MHVLYFHQHFSTPAGSTGTRSYEMARMLLTRGHQVTMVCGSYAYGKTGLSGEAKQGVRSGVVDGIKVVEICLPYSNKDGFIKRAITFMRFAFKSIGVALSTRYDILFATSTPLTAGIPGIVMKLFKPGRPFVFEVRDLWPELPREMGVIKNPLVLWGMSVLEWSSYKAASACIALSPGIREGVLRRSSNGKRVAMIPNGCDLDLFKPASRRDVSEKFLAVFTGAHGIANGLDAVLDAAGVLANRGRNDIRLRFIGDGKLKPALMERVKKDGLNNCAFIDPMPKVALGEVLQEAGACLMILANVPAFYYGTSPNKFFDYISAGLPVINNYPGWLAEMIEEHNCGRAIAPGKSEEFADALEFMADNPAECEAMGIRARKLAEKEFDRSGLARKFAELLEEVHEASL